LISADDRLISLSGKRTGMHDNKTVMSFFGVLEDGSNTRRKASTEGSR